MELGINLLKKRSAISRKQRQLEKKLFGWSMVVFVVVVVSSIVIFVMNLLAVRNLEKTETEIKRINSELVGLQEANFRQLYLKNRLQLVGDFFRSRISGREAIQRIFSIDIPGVTISGVTFESDTELALQLDSKNIHPLNEAYEYFGGVETFFPQVINRGVSRMDEGEYIMQLDLIMPGSEGDDE